MVGVGVGVFVTVGVSVPLARCLLSCCCFIRNVVIASAIRINAIAPIKINFLFTYLSYLFGDNLPTGSIKLRRGRESDPHRSSCISAWRGFADPRVTFQEEMSTHFASANLYSVLRRGRESDPRIEVLQTPALPLRHRAIS